MQKCIIPIDLLLFRSQDGHPTEEYAREFLELACTQKMLSWWRFFRG